MQTICLHRKATWWNLKLRLAFGVAVRLNIALGVKIWIQCVYNMYINIWVNMKRLAVIQDRLCYALFYVLDLCTLYKKQAERGCFFNIKHLYLQTSINYYNHYSSFNYCLWNKLYPMIYPFLLFYFGCKKWLHNGCNSEINMTKFDQF